MSPITSNDHFKEDFQPKVKKVAVKKVKYRAQWQFARDCRHSQDLTDVHPRASMRTIWIHFGPASFFCDFWRSMVIRAVRLKKMVSTEKSEGGYLHLFALTEPHLSAAAIADELSQTRERPKQSIRIIRHHRCPFWGEPGCQCISMDREAW